MSNIRDSWTTPKWLWDAVLRGLRMDEFDLDPCANEWSTVPAKTKVMLPDNGLTYRVKHGETAWLNYPFSDPASWLRWAREQRGRVVALGPLTLETIAVAEYGAENGLSLGRVRFVPPPGIKESRPTQQHMLMFYRLSQEERDSISSEVAFFTRCCYQLERFYD